MNTHIISLAKNEVLFRWDSTLTQALPINQSQLFMKEYQPTGLYIAAFEQDELYHRLALTHVRDAVSQNHVEALDFRNPRRRGPEPIPWANLGFVVLGATFGTYLSSFDWIFKNSNIESYRYVNYFAASIAFALALKVLLFDRKDFIHHVRMNIAFNKFDMSRNYVSFSEKVRLFFMGRSSS